jgi:glycosyltransferase involved in cell wall biosynthesis
MNSETLISVLMNCYNSEKYLDETLQSLFSQTYPNWQLVFVNNCSTDNSNIIIDKYKQDSRVSYLQTPHHMPLGEARELGLTRCSGDFICFLDTDDIWISNKLEKQLEFLQRNPKLLLCYSSYFFIDEKSKITGKQHLRFKSGDLFGENLAKYEINFQTVMIRRNALNSVNTPYFDPTLKYCPDYNLIMRILACCSAVCLEEELVYYRISPDSLSQKTIDLWGVEAEYTYQQLDTLGLLVPNSTPRQRQLALATIAYLKAISMMSHNDCMMAVEILKEYRFINYKYYIVYRAARFPLFWKWIHSLKERMR